MNVARLLATKGRDVVTIRPEQTIRQAVDLLARHNIGALVVVDSALKPVGILSERDIVRHLAQQENLLAQPASLIMTAMGPGGRRISRICCMCPGNAG